MSRQSNPAAFEKTELSDPAINAVGYERTVVTHPGTASVVAMNATLIAPPAPVSLLGDLDTLGSSVDLACRNIGPLGRRRYVVPAATLSDEFFEELSKVMLGYPSALVERFSVAA